MWVCWIGGLACGWLAVVHGGGFACLLAASCFRGVRQVTCVLLVWIDVWFAGLVSLDDCVLADFVVGSFECFCGLNSGLAIGGSFGWVWALFVGFALFC